jgi:mono/diheme cytochrome c family protein
MPSPEIYDSHNPAAESCARGKGLVAVLLAAAVGGALLLSMGNRLGNGALQQAPLRVVLPPDLASDPHLGRGAMVYSQYCQTCHGAEADGNGPASTVLDPAPRNFKMGKYRLITAVNGNASRADIIHTIRNGMPGTSMPAWMHLSNDDVEAVTDYVLAITRDSLRQQMTAKGFKGKKLDTILEGRLTPEKPVVVPVEPAISDAGLARGKELYLQTCAKCHADDGHGVADPTWRTAEGLKIASRNFTAGVFKGGGRPGDLYTRTYAGLPGTPMPGFGSAFKPDDIWNVVHYVQTLARQTPAAAPIAPTAAASTQPAVPIHLSQTNAGGN